MTRTLLLLPPIALLFAPYQDPASRQRARPVPVFDGGLTCVMQVEDLAASIAWYRNVVGFEVLYTMPDLGWAELRTPVGSVHVGLMRVAEPRTGAGAVLTFGVRDIAESRRRLDRAGARIEGDIRTIPDLVQLLSFLDPDGNRLQLYQPLKPAGAGALAPVVFLAGSWRSGSGAAFQEEHWTSPAGGSMLGIARTVSGGRMSFFEHLRIEERPGEGVFYVVSPAGRAAVEFKLGETGPDRAVFENPEHDFPSRITYWLDGDGVLRARLEGKPEGTPKSREFAWKRSGLVASD